MEDLSYNIKRIFENDEINSLTPGFAIGVYSEKVEEFYFQGLASVEENIPISKSTKFHIASITKYFTAILFRKLEQEGLIKEDDLVSSFIPIEILNKNHITFKHLLTHTSGLRDQWDLTDLGGWQKSETISTKDILGLLNSQLSLNFSPGSYYCYCNTGYTLIALALEKASGYSIRYLLKKYITEDIGLESTGYYSHDEILTGFAKAYQKQDSGNYEVSKPSFDVIGSTSMYLSVGDMIKFEKSPISKHLMDDVSSTYLAFPNKKDKIFYHDGLIYATISGKHFEMHSGWDYGYSSFLLRLDEIGASIVIFANLGIPKLFNYALKVARLLDPQLKNIPFLKLPEEDLSERISSVITDGFFVNDISNVVLEIKKNGDKFFLDGDELIVVSENKFRINNGMTQLEMSNPQLFSINTLGSILSYSIILRKSVENLNVFEGIYYNNELNIRYNISWDNGNLILRSSKKREWNLIIITDEFFKTDRFSLKFNFDGCAIVGFTLSTTRSWNVFFKREI